MSSDHPSLIDQLAQYASSSHSPCVGHCTYDDQDFCLSCRRHTDEIGQWRDAGDDLRQAAWARIPAEIDDAGIETMRLPLSPHDIAEIAIDVLDHGGSWAVGARGCYAYAHDLEGEEDGILNAVSEDGETRITLDLSGKMRALVWTRDGTTGRQLSDGLGGLPLLLVVPKVRLDLPVLDEGTVIEDGEYKGATDCGLGLAHCQMMTKGDDLMIKTMLAQASIKNGKAQPLLGDDLPQGLILPESYVLAAVLLPKGEAPLG